MVTILFKEEDARFTNALAPLASELRFVPLLRVEPLDQCSAALSALLARPIDALLFTSMHAVDVFAAWLAATPSAAAALQRCCVAALGARLCDRVRQLDTAFDRVIGDACGNAEQLAQLFVESLAATDLSPRRLAVHFLCGERRMPTIEAALATRADIELHVTPLYDTRPLESVAPLAELLPQEARSWVVFFSPSGVDLVLRDNPANVAALGQRARIACIGQTTAAAVRSVAGLSVDAVAAKPTPEALAEAMHASLH